MVKRDMKSSKIEKPEEESEARDKGGKEKGKDKEREGAKTR